MKIDLKGPANNSSSAMIPMQMIGELVCETNKGITNMMTEMEKSNSFLGSLGEKMDEGIAQSKEGVAQSKKVVSILEKLNDTVEQLVTVLKEERGGSNT